MGRCFALSEHILTDVPRNARNEISIRTFFWSYTSIPVLLAIQQLLIGPKESYRQGDFDDETSPGTLVGLETEAVNNSATFEGFSAPTAGPPGENSASKSKSASGDGALTSRSPERWQERAYRSKFYPIIFGARQDYLINLQISGDHPEILISCRLIVLFLCIHMCRINYYIQTVSQQLIFYLQDQNLAETVSTAFTILLPTAGSSVRRR
ncbi:hypothetical protein BS47DRAFT_401609 [Hydnum rufescens UP504]|uniref:Uncharacterized protein n=1 Tax=Hydnum rufescens UP504 TaxID=1448309 RepID=A0A9P6BAS1_9AGAM|nr:hypothetical protein BS47DRAFT_401609 [Hydnum rufescens UP504]